MINPYESVANAQSATYKDVRPGYPDAAVDWLLEPLPSHMRLTIADIGAGTGKFTELLARRDCTVWAVEPSAAMRQEFAQALPNFPQGHLVNARAEQTLLPDSCCDGAIYAQSWHWLDSEAASNEAARILKNHGVIGILYNQLAVEIPWVHRLSRIMRSGDVARAHKPPQLTCAFTSPEFLSLDWEDTVTPEQIIELGTTRASWIQQSPEGRAWMSGNLRWYLYEHLGFAQGQSVHLPYHTYAWRASCL